MTGVRTRKSICGRLKPIALGIFVTVVFLPLGHRAWAPTLYLTTQTIFEKPFDRTLCMAEFNGGVYAGVGRDSAAKLYRLCHDGCRIWEDVTPPWRTDTSESSMAMAEFNGLLYVGTDKGELFRTADGLTWWNVTNNLPTGASNAITDMAVFNGYFYISYFLIEIRRSSDGLAWSPVVGPSPALHPAGFGNAKNHDLNSIEAFNGYLYAGVGRDNINGIQIWRSNNGVNWSLFKEEVQSEPPPPILDILPGHVHAMSVFNNKLYIGWFEGQAIYRTDGSGSSWDLIYDATVIGHGILRLGEHAGKLFMGMYDRLTDTYVGDKMLFESTDGSSWSQAVGSPVVDYSNNGIGALLSSDGILYAGTISAKNYGTDPTGTVQIREIGWAPQLTCRLKDAEKVIYSLKGRFIDMANMARFCNPPPNWFPQPYSLCFLGFIAYGQAVIPTSGAWVYSPIEEIKTALQSQVWPRNETAIQKKQAYLDEMNTEFRSAMNSIILAYYLIDTLGPEGIAGFLTDAEKRLRRAAQLCVVASYVAGARSGTMGLLLEKD